MWKEVMLNNRRKRERKTHLVADDGVIGQTQVGMRIVSELQGTLVELRHRLVHVQDGVLLVDLTDHLVEST